MGIVYYANYLAWFEIGRTDLLRQMGSSYKEIEQHEKIYLPVIEAHCHYHSPARYDDIIEIRTKATREALARIRFDYELLRIEDEVVLASGSTLHVAVNANGRPCRLPPRLAELFE